MFTAFDLTLSPTCMDKKWESEGRGLFSAQREKVISLLQSYTIGSGTLNGTKIQSDWFPEINADVFISHSHDDEAMALNLAGWLYVAFGIRSFIDSSVWGYAPDLLKLIDDKHCKIEGSDVYDYNKRNGSTSHVHMMLSVALAKMIDRTECVLFLNTPSSLTIKDATATVGSPWLYNEIALCDIVERKTPSTLIKKSSTNFSRIDESRVPVEYIVDLGKFPKLNINTLAAWSKSGPKSIREALDILYYLVLPQK